MKKKHKVDVKVKQTPKSTKYIYIVDGKTVRNSTRRYAVSTADGSYFSSRMDLLIKNAEYQRDLQYAVHRANLTESQYNAEQKAILDSYKKDYAKYSSVECRDKWIDKSVGILFHFGNTPTEQEIKDWKEKDLRSWSEWMLQAKDSLDKQLLLMNDKNLMLQDLNNIRERGKKRLEELDIVMYNF